MASNPNISKARNMVLTGQFVTPVSYTHLKVVDASEGTLTLEVDGEQYTLETANAYVVGKNGDRKSVV